MSRRRAGTTSSGAAAIWLGLALLLVAGLLDAEPFYVPAAAFLLLGLGAAAWVTLAARGAGVQRELSGRRVVEDEPLMLRLVARAGRMPLPGGELRDPLLPQPARLPAGGGGFRLRVRVRFARRGLRRLEPPSLALRDPLGLAERLVRGAGEDEVLVLPRVEPVRMADERARARRDAASGLLGALAPVAEVELDGVRPLREGTPASRIHWPALARGAGLQERRFQGEGDARPLVVLDARAPAREEDLDAAVRAAASLARWLARRGGCAVLLPGERRPAVLDAELAGWPVLHARLALVQAGGAPPRLASAGARTGPVVYVAARLPSRLPALLAQARRAQRALVVPGAQPGRRAAFRVAGCEGYVVERGGAFAEAA
jgi:uncharacterized protein (DUF58 family)